MIAGLVLAAGESRRFGAPKQLARLRGRPLLEHALAAMTASPVDATVAVLGANARAILGEVDLHGARPVECQDWSSGQSASLKAGVAAVPEADAIVVVLGDQPFLSPRAVATVIDGREPGFDAVRATYDGQPGHPVLIERTVFVAVRRLHGDEGARSLLEGARVRHVPCDGLGRPDDIDTREQLEDAT